MGDVGNFIAENVETDRNAGPLCQCIEASAMLPHRFAVLAWLGLQPQT